MKQFFAKISQNNQISILKMPPPLTHLFTHDIINTEDKKFAH